MKVEYDERNDIVYVILKEGKVVDSEEIEEGIIVDYLSLIHI